MNKIKEISSVQNPLIKKVLLLKEKSRERKKEGLFILEGLRELELAIKGTYEIQFILFHEAIVSKAEVLKIIATSQTSPDLISVSKDVYQKIAYRDTTEGILAVVKVKSHKLSDLKLENKKPFILVAEAPEKPGNIGALLRTADAANLDAILIANPKTDIYNPNIIRSSVGCVFSRKIAIASSEDIINFLKEKNIATYCAALTASTVYTKVSYVGATAVVVGTEDNGLSKEWLDTSTQNVIIPMEGEIDSMNVSVSAAILIFEGKRQRREI